MSALQIGQLGRPSSFFVFHSSMHSSQKLWPQVTVAAQMMAAGARQQAVVKALYRDGRGERELGATEAALALVHLAQCGTEPPLGDVGRRTVRRDILEQPLDQHRTPRKPVDESQCARQPVGARRHQPSPLPIDAGIYNPGVDSAAEQ